MAQGEIYRATLVFADSGPAKTYTTAFALRQVTTAGFDVNDVEGVVVTWWTTAYTNGVAMRTLYPPEISLEEVKLRKISPLEPVETVSTVGLPLVGTSAADQLPGQNAVLVSSRTGKIGRRYRGRNFLPSPSEGVLGESLSVGLAEDIAFQWSGLIGDLKSIGVLSASQADMGVWSKTASEFTPYIRAQVDIRIRTQRRRAVRAATYESANV